MQRLRLRKMQIEKASARYQLCEKAINDSTKKHNTCKKSGLTTIQISIAIPDEAQAVGVGTRTAKV